MGVQLYDNIKSTTQETPDKVCIYLNDLSITYGEFWKRCHSIRKEINEKLGSEVQKCIALELENKDSFLITLYAVFFSGHIAVPIDKNNTKQRSYIIENCSPALFIAEGETLIEEADNLLLYENINERNIVEDRHFIIEDKVCLLLYTSGTSGPPKGVMQTVSNLQVTADYLGKYMETDHTIVESVMAPIDHAFGLGRCRAVLNIGGTIVLSSTSFDPIQILATLEKFECNSISGPSTAVAILMKFFKKQLLKFKNTINWIELGSVPMSEENKKKLCDLFPSANIIMNFGLTEAMRTTLINFNSEKTKLHTVGRAAPGNKIKVVSGTGLELASGETGHIEVMGPHLASGYWRNSKVWNQKTNEGWFRTGDLGYLDDDGYLIYIGRSDDMINIGGNKISPIEIENKISEYIADFPEFYVSARNDENDLYGEVPILCLESKNQNKISMNIIKEVLNTNIQSIYLPKDIVYIHKFPKTENGKIKRKELKGIIEGPFNESI